MLLFPLFVVIIFFGVGFAENSDFSRLKIKETEAQYRYCRMIFNELVEKTPNLAKEKYSNILFDFLRPVKGSSMDPPLCWCVNVALDRVTNAEFECKNMFKVEKSSFDQGTNARLKTINDEKYEGDVQLEFYDYKKEVKKPRFKIEIRSLYVADYRPFISGTLILNLVKKMVDSLQPDAIATLYDSSNLKVLAFVTTGETYYEHLGFHYVNRDETKMAEERNKFQKTKINPILFLSCVSIKLNERMQVRLQSFLFDGALKGAILGALKAEVGPENRQLEDFWKIYRNVMKRVDFYALQEEFDFETYLQRYAKTYFFTRYFRECLQGQIIKDEKFLEFGFVAIDLLDRMIYP